MLARLTQGNGNGLSAIVYDGPLFAARVQVAGAILVHDAMHFALKLALLFLAPMAPLVRRGRLAHWEVWGVGGKKKGYNNRGGGG